jgi:glycosyltransferase involved in cell wall biosynthesis
VRVLIVHDYGTPVGGADQMSVSLRDDLRRRGHDARLFASSAAAAPVPNRADDLCFGTQTRARELLQLANPSAAWRLRQTIARFRPDVVHVGIYSIQLSPLILPALRDHPSLLYLVNYDQVCPANTKLLPDGRPCTHHAGRICRSEGCVPLRSLARFSAQRALSERWRGVFDLVVTPSDWVAERLRGDGVAVDEVVWNGVPATTRRPPLTGPPTVGYAGRLVAKKGVGVLLEAVSLVRRTIPDVRLVVAGDGPEGPALRERSAALGLGDSVVWRGHLDRPGMEAALAPAWVQAVPSVWAEPFGMVAAEAMMRGTTVVASRSGGLTEFVREGETGQTTPPGDAAALADALLGVLGDREQAERLGASASRFALAQLGEDRFTDRVVELYERIVANSSP